MSRIYCPIENAYAERVKRAKKSHICGCCKREISTGSSYVCIHKSTDHFYWETGALCNNCYVEMFEADFDYTPPTKALPDGVETAYKTSDGAVFSTVREAERHIAIQAGAKDCMMWDGGGVPTSKVDECMMLKILSFEGMRYFITKCEQFMEAHPGDRDVSGGLIDDFKEDPDLFKRIKPTYLWNDTEYIFIDDDQRKAFVGYLRDAFKHTEPMLPLTKEELNHLINDTIAYIWQLECRPADKITTPENDTFGYYSRKRLLDKLKAFEAEYFPKMECNG